MQWYVISLRPRGMHGAMRQAAARHGAGLVELSPWAIRRRDDADTRASLARALAAPRVLFTSPVAVRAADALQPLASVAAREWLAVGAGTAAALRRAGVENVQAPGRMDSEGVLALPALQQVAGSDVGLVTAPDGRGVIPATLQARGARVLQADVYVREPVAPDPDSVDALLALQGPAVLLLTSGAALEHVLGLLPPAARARLLACHVAAASDRLVELARSHGFKSVARAADPRPAPMLAGAAGLAGFG